MEKLNKITAGIIFIFSTIVYTITVAPTLSFWDCGEFIACSFKMAVPHPPGSPLYLLVGRVFSFIPVGDVAFRVNLISVLSSSITVMLLYLVIVHLIRQWKIKLDSSDWYTAIFSGVLGSLTFAFTHSFWFNAAEAEVYALSMLFTALIVWLAMVWVARSDEPGNERYLLLIVYIIGLAIAVHLLNVLALPFVAMIVFYKRFEFNLKNFLIMTGITVLVMLAVYPGMIKWMPHLALHFGAPGLVLFFIVIIGVSFWAINNHKHILSLVFISFLLISIGYSSYATIFIRSNLNPMIDENNPETIDKFIDYVERKQYGEHDIFDRERVWKTSDNAKNYQSTWDFVWRYQFNKMYTRYFNWQFLTMSEDAPPQDYTRGMNARSFWMFPILLLLAAVIWSFIKEKGYARIVVGLYLLVLIANILLTFYTFIDSKYFFGFIAFHLGLIGAYWHFRNDPKHALAVLALFIMTGLAIIIYLNQPDPQPRERDYSYVGSFFAFSIWVGFGYAGIVDMIRTAFRKPNIKPALQFAVAAILILAAPIHMMAKNFNSHDRSGNYVAWDYSYNMLMSCEPNAILFTNGDNDTFPLWYLQEVEGIRTDVRIANLSLLNTDWYIEQLRDMDPKVPMRINDAELERLNLFQWEAQVVTLSVPQSVAREAKEEYKQKFEFIDVETPDKISFEVKPAMYVPDRQGGRVGVLRTQDRMILNIIAANRWRKPIYFAVTVPQSNMLSELADYLRMDGLLLKLVPYRDWDISPTHLYENLVNKYRYRGLTNPDVYFNDNIMNLLQNYRSAFLQLAEYYHRVGEREKLNEILTVMEEKIDPQVIPWSSRTLRNFKEAFHIVNDSTYADSVITKIDEQRDLLFIGQHLMRLRAFDLGMRLLEAAYQINPMNPQALQSLIQAYEISGNTEKAIAPLEAWVERNPSDRNAKRILESLKQRVKN